MTPRTPLAIAAALWLVGGPAAAWDAPTECTTSGGGWTVTASDPFEAEGCPADACTGITYTLVSRGGGTPDHVAVLADHEVDIVVPSSNFVGAPCEGDSVTLLGLRDCSTKSVRVNESQQKTGPFDLVVEGRLQPVSSSIVVKKGKRIEQCRIASLGAPPASVYDPKAQVTTSQTIDFEGCVATIPTDVETGEGGEATLAGEGCVFVANALPVGIAKLLVDGKDVGAVSWGQGAISSGSDSCTTRVINRRLYTWCTCTDANGDGVTEDPRPPCP